MRRSTPSRFPAASSMSRGESSRTELGGGTGRNPRARDRPRHGAPLRHADEPAATRAGGLVAGMIVSPQVAQFGDLAQTGLGMLFLKFSRSDESQADHSGSGTCCAVATIRGQSSTSSACWRGQRAGGAAGRLPQWLRATRTGEPEAGRLGRRLAQPRPLGPGPQPSAYLRRIDDIVFGENRGRLLPGQRLPASDMAFRLQFPPLEDQQREAGVGAVSPNQDAVVVLQLAPGRVRSRRRSSSFRKRDRAGSEWRRQIGASRVLDHVRGAK